MKKIIIAMGFLGLFAGGTTAVFAGYFNTTPISRCDSQITRTLQVGREDNEVYTLQNMLSQAGYLQANPNGYFGQGTKSAVKAFQLDNSLSATGVVGEDTRNAINERLCDSDPRGDALSYNSYGYGYGYNSGVTYVDQYDPYAMVISPKVTTPAIYSNPQENNNISYSNTSNLPTPTPYISPLYSSNDYPLVSVNSNGYQTISPNVVTAVGHFDMGNTLSSAQVLIPATTQSKIQSTGIVYSSSNGYMYGVVPESGSLTILNPVSNSVYNEGDTVYLDWTTNNLNIAQLQILLENTSTGQSKQVTITTGNSVSFVLTKELLDAVCAGACNNNQQGSFKIVIATPIVDIAGISSNFRAAVAPITIRRPFSNYATVTLSASKTPVDSGEKFKLYTNIPTGSSWNTNLYGNYSIKIHAICPSSVSVSIAGVGCGQDFVIPLAPVSFQQEIPVMITNPTWYRQDVTFEIVVSNLKGETIGSSRTTVTANAAPFSW